MASTNTLLHLTPLAASLPATLFAQPDIIVGQSVPVEGVPVLAFDSTTQEYADFRCKMPQHYAGGGVTLVICSGAGTATGGITWGAAFRAIEDDTEDLDTTGHTYDYNEVDIATLASVQGEVTYDNITFTDGADMDSTGAGDEFILRITRIVADANDTAAADGFIHGLELRET